MTHLATYSRCLQYARRRARDEGIVFHIVRTDTREAPLRVLDEHQLFQHTDTISPWDIVDSIDPFFEPNAGKSSP
jgi:hypothetical protein